MGTFLGGDARCAEAEDRVEFKVASWFFPHQQISQRTNDRGCNPFGSSFAI